MEDQTWVYPVVPDCLERKAGSKVRRVTPYDGLLANCSQELSEVFGEPASQATIRGAHGMGFTRYWKCSSEADESAYQAALAEIRALMQASPVPLTVAMRGGTDSDSSSIAVNGSAATDDASEDFTLPAHASQLGRFAFCKTAARPYDLVVSAALAVLADRLGVCFNVSSDGDGSDWDQGVRFACATLGRAVRHPIYHLESAEPSVPDRGDEASGAPTLADRFRASVGAPVEHDGLVVHRAWEFRTRTPCVLSFIVEQLASGIVQGLAMKARGGHLVVIGQKGIETAVYPDFAGERFRVTLVPHQPEMTVMVWNVWEDDQEPHRSQTGNSGMLIRSDAQETRLYCSVDGPSPDFSSMTVAVRVT